MTVTFEYYERGYYNVLPRTVNMTYPPRVGEEVVITDKEDDTTYHTFMVISVFWRITREGDVKATVTIR